MSNEQYEILRLVVKTFVKIVLTIDNIVAALVLLAMLVCGAHVVLHFWRGIFDDF